ncbi:hypothetical protein [Rhodohalobacter sulfatireducens]|uniref:Uncharacterized protein n=1 Tax=Rhodohalobacter sulfatireducens TaxID=2911366 RepID=A0ABS9KD28_9BACT|nr:hypothetical protein [Rhodohalobacter sulfatireducens]MCG2588767.1 hypothetical protein [Rhodohalobacter sulfatireducens]
MWILNLFLLFTAIAGVYTGAQPWFRFDRLNKTNVLNGTLITLSVFTLLMVLYVLGFFPQSIAAPFMMVLYSFLGGFFFGYAVRLYNLRKESGYVLYQHRSFWVDHAPNLLALGIILFGIFRTAVLTDQIITGIRVTSGLSMICFGLFTWTLKAVPEFRSKGVILLDRYILWEEVISWRWIGEDILGIEYLVEEEKTEDRIKEFTTTIPEIERKEIEMILKSKMDEYFEERKKRLLDQED